MVAAAGMDGMQMLHVQSRARTHMHMHIRSVQAQIAVARREAGEQASPPTHQRTDRPRDADVHVARPERLAILTRRRMGVHCEGADG